MSRPILLLRKYAILTHRWMGVFFCVLFCAWFLSGIVLMYWDFPVVSAQDRLAKAPALDASRILLSPRQAFDKLEAGEAPTQVRIATLDGRPVYRFRFRGSQLSVFADNGELLDVIPVARASRIAAAWSGQSAVTATMEAITEPDQWTVFPEVRREKPYWRATWPNGEEVYVSQRSGEVAQHTTRASRRGAYLGAIPHWLYFTALRQNTPAWRLVIIWLSGGGILMNLLGLIVGTWLYSPSKRYRFPDGASHIPYAGQKRWHTILGLIFGLFAMTWVMSGMFSMNPLSWSPDSAPEAPADVLRGPQWSADAFAGESPREALAKVAGELRVKELSLTHAAGEAVYLARETPLRSRVIPIDGDSFEQFPPGRVLQRMVQAARPHGLTQGRVVTEYEPYYIDRHARKPLPVLFVRLDDAEQSIYYIDLKTAQVVESYDARSRWNRWLYHGLHSMDLPWLYRNRPAWDLTVLTLMLGGTALCVTSLVIGWRRMRSKIRNYQTNPTT